MVIGKPQKPKRSNFLSNYVDSSYGVGKRVYNGSSPSPHAGAGGVNPAGYATRDNMARVKKARLMEFIKRKTI